jgi:hypothetical protein
MTSSLLTGPFVTGRLLLLSGKMQTIVKEIATFIKKNSNFYQTRKALACLDLKVGHVKRRWRRIISSTPGFF